MKKQKKDIGLVNIIRLDHKKSSTYYASIIFKILAIIYV